MTVGSLNVAPVSVCSHAPAGNAVIVDVISVSKLGGKSSGGVMAMAPQTFSTETGLLTSDFK
jgi:hypothetical protein